MLKETGTIMHFDDDTNTFYNSVSDTTLEDLTDDYVSRNLYKRALTNDKVQLPVELRLFPGWECVRPFEPRCGYSKEWQELVRIIAVSKGCSIPPLELTKPAGAAATSSTRVAPSAAGPSTAGVSAAGASESGGFTSATGVPSVLGYYFRSRRFSSRLSSRRHSLRPNLRWPVLTGRLSLNKR